MNQGYPAIPAEGTGVGSLVSVANYEQVTGDTVNSDQDIIDQAVIEVCQYCNRTLGYGQYTERLFVNKRALVYPSALPLDAVTPVTLPVEAAVYGPAIWTGLWAPIPDLPIFTGIIAPQANVTYWGGYQVAGNNAGPTPPLPPKLMRAICRLSWYLANPVVMSGVPAGATSVSLQGVTVSGMSSPISSWESDTALTKVLTAFRRPEIPAFGN